MLAIVSRVTIRPGREEEFAAILRQVAEQSLALEPGCHSYQGLRQSAESNRFIVIEQYDDRDALNAHRASPHFCEAMAGLANLVDGEPEITFCETL